MRSLRILPALLLLLLLGGCVFPSGDELLAAPNHLAITKACRLSWKSSWHRAYPTPRRARAKTVRLFSLPIWTTTA